MRSSNSDPGPRVSPAAARQWVAGLRALQQALNDANLDRKASWQGADSLPAAQAELEGRLAQLRARSAEFAQRDGITPSRVEHASTAAAEHARTVDSAIAKINADIAAPFMGEFAEFEARHQ